MQALNNPILRCPNAWRYAILEHLVCWVHRESFIAGNINEPKIGEHFWRIFLYYYNLNRNFKSGEDGANLGGVFSIFEAAKIPQSEDDFCNGVASICKSVLALAGLSAVEGTKVGGPKSAASKVLFNKNSNFGFIFDSRASRSLRAIDEGRQISDVPYGYSFETFTKKYYGNFSKYRSLIDGVLQEYTVIPGMNAGRVVDKLLYLNGEPDIARWQNVLDATALLAMFKDCDEAAKDAGAKLSKIFEETT